MDPIASVLLNSCQVAFGKSGEYANVSTFGSRLTRRRLTIVSFQVAGKVSQNAGSLCQLKRLTDCRCRYAWVTK
jgi:hypothetical protein